MESPKRTFLLADVLLEGNGGELIKLIQEVNAYDDEQEKKVVDFKRKPIEITICSPGGRAFMMLAIVSAMKASKTPIHTYGYGEIMSAGLGIFLSGHVRYADKTATFMYHGVGYGVWGTLPKHEQELGLSKQLQKYYDQIVLKNSKLKKKQLEEVVAKSANLYLTGKQALKLGLVDELIKRGHKKGAKTA